MRFAGTWKQYSKKAMPQLTAMTFHSASLRYLRWPYQAKVMKIFEMVSSRMVRTSDISAVGLNSVRRSLLGTRYASRELFGLGAKGNTIKSELKVSAQNRSGHRL